MIRPPPRSTRVRSSAASDVYKRQLHGRSCPAPRTRLLCQASSGARTASTGHGVLKRTQRIRTLPVKKTGPDSTNDQSHHDYPPPTSRAKKRVSLLLPLIRTFTVGPGISPSSPAAGCGRVADSNRRFGITPITEHLHPLCHRGCESPASFLRTLSETELPAVTSQGSRSQRAPPPSWEASSPRLYR